MYVYMDDYRPHPPGFVLARDMEECIALLENGEIEVLSLDYDLGWGEPTGLDLVRVMVERGLYAKEIYLHSSSLSGRNHMYQLLSQHVPDSVQLFHGGMPERRLEQIRQEMERGETK
jgi:hypothetical protein